MTYIIRNRMNDQEYIAYLENIVEDLEAEVERLKSESRENLREENRNNQVMVAGV